MNWSHNCLFFLIDIPVPGRLVFILKWGLVEFIDMSGGGSLLLTHQLEDKLKVYEVYMDFLKAYGLLDRVGSDLECLKQDCSNSNASTVKLPQSSVKQLI